MWARRFSGLALVVGVSSTPLAVSTVAETANKDLVITYTERWIDTLKVRVKNVSPDRAEDVVVVVRFYGDPASPAPGQRPPRAPRRQELGQQTSNVPALGPGEEAPFEMDIAEKHRRATFYKFEPHAVWPRSRKK
jgi:hypothetical protein